MQRKPTQTPNSRPPVQAPLAERTAEELAVMAARENLAAFGELVTRYEARLFNFLLRRVASRTDAEDLTQEAFVRAWERIDSYDPTWRFSTWLFTIASRLAVSHHRRSRRVAHIESAEQVVTPPADPRDTEADARNGGKLWAIAHRVLKPDQQTALWLRYAEDMAVAEISKVMHKTQVGVRVCLFRARQALAEAAAAEGFVIGEIGGAMLESSGVAPAVDSRGTRSPVSRRSDGSGGER